MMQIQLEKQKASVMDYLKIRKQNGYTTVSDVDVMDHFDMPIEDVDRIFLELKREGILVKHNHHVSH